jgi:hypothetical protein
VNHVALAVLVLAAAGDLWFVRALQPTTLRSGAILALWLLTPLVMAAAWLRASQRSRAQSAAAGIVTTLVAAGGASFLIDAIYVHPDAQGAIAVVFAPIYQMGALVVLAPLSGWIASRVRRSP